MINKGTRGMPPNSGTGGLNTDSILPGSASYREQDFDYRGPDFFNRNPGVQNRSIYGNIQGRHRGKAPKNYKRSDEKISEDICDVLTDDPHVDASEIEFEVTNGDVKVSGTVADRYQKRKVEDLIEEIRGVSNIENNIRVVTHEKREP
jgi:hypothetical protein